MRTDLDSDAATPLEASLRARVDTLARAAIDMPALAASGLLAVDVPVDRGGLGGGFSDLVAALVALAEIDPALASAAVLGHVAHALALPPAEPILIASPPLPWLASELGGAGSLEAASSRVWGAATPSRLVVALDAGAGELEIHVLEGAGGAHIEARDPSAGPFASASAVRFDRVDLGPARLSGADALGFALRFAVLVAAAAVALGTRALALADVTSVDALPGHDAALAELRRTDMATRIDAARLLCARAAAVATARPDDDAEALVVEALLFAVAASTDNTLAGSLAVGAASPRHFDAALALHAEALRLRAVVARGDDLRAALSVRLATKD
jgi:hypothetical protein